MACLVFSIPRKANLMRLQVSENELLSTVFVLVGLRELITDVQDEEEEQDDEDDEDEGPL